MVAATLAEQAIANSRHVPESEQLEISEYKDEVGKSKLKLEETNQEIKHEVQTVEELTEAAEYASKEFASQLGEAELANTSLAEDEHPA